MTLRTKVLLIMGVALIGFTLLLYVVLNTILNNGFAELETESILSNTQRAANTLNNEVEQLNTITGDWAPWYDTIDFIEGRYDDYVDENLTNKTFANLGVNAMLFLDAADRLVYSKAIDLEKNEEIPLSQDLQELVHQKVLTGHTDPYDVAGGLVLLPEGLALISSRPIVGSAFEPPIHGTLIMAKYITQDLIRDWSERTRLSTGAYPIDSAMLPPGLFKRLSELPETSPYLAEVIDEKTAAGYQLIEDINGNPAAVLKVELPRPVQAQSQTTTFYIFLALVGLAVIALTASYLILEREVLGRLSRLIEAITQIETRGPFAPQIPLSGHDELSQVAEAINHMLLQIQESKQEIIEARDELQIANHALRFEAKERERNQELIESSLREKEVLLKEIHHRVKNNLQIVSSLLYLQSLKVESPVVLQILQDSESRIKSMALVHEKLYQTENLAKVSFRDYIQALAGHLAQSYGAAYRGIQITLDTEAIELPIDLAVPCGLIVNELFANALKHAFPDGQGGQVQIGLHSAGGVDGSEVMLMIADNGVGLPHDIDVYNTQSLGMQLVNTLVKQLDGVLTLESNNGTRFKVQFPYQRE